MHRFADVLRFRRAFSCLLLTTFVAAAPAAQTTAAPASEDLTYDVEMKIVSVATDITGDGLTSQTLPGSEGTFQILHEKWDGLSVRMEGAELAMELPKEGDSPVRLLSAPSARGVVGEQVAVSIGDSSPVQYLEPMDADTFKLKNLAPGNSPLGLSIILTPKPMTDRAGVWEVPFQLTSTYLAEREALEGVALNVGKPRVESLTRTETIGVRDGEWAGYRTRVPGPGGMLYFFLKVTKHIEAAPEEVVPAQVSVESKVIVVSKQQLALLFPALDAAKTSLKMATLEVESARELFKEFDKLDAELISAPRITMALPPAMMKIVLRNQSPIGGGGGGFGGGGQGGAVPAPDPLSDLLPATQNADGTVARDFSQLYRKLSPTAMIPDSVDTRCIISDISENGNGVLISLYPEPMGEDGIQLDYLFQMRDAEGFWQFRQTIMLGDHRAGVFVMPHGKEDTLVVIVEANRITDRAENSPASQGYQPVAN